jgi:hypothetical protein
MPRIASRLALAAVGLTAATSAGASPRSTGGCFVDWADAAPIVMRERLVAVSDLSRLAREKMSGDLVKTTLCAEHGRFVYKLLVRDTGGGLKNLTVDARRPFER